jgi:hypothetical protein
MARFPLSDRTAATAQKRISFDHTRSERKLGAAERVSLTGVRLLDPLEPPIGLAGVAHAPVRVPLHGEPPVGGAHVGGGRVLPDAEQGVVAARGRAGAGATGGIAGSGGGVHGGAVAGAASESARRGGRGDANCYRGCIELGGRGERRWV